MYANQRAVFCKNSKKGRQATMPDGCGDKILLPISPIPCHAVAMRYGRGRLSGGTKVTIEPLVDNN